MINEHDELLIQKCVDGELDVAAQQELLAALDEMADGWKFLALAYVEEQAWCGSFGDANGASREVEVGLQYASFEPMSQAPSMEQIDLQEVQCFMPPQEPEREASSRRSVVVTQVTCLAIALVGGVLIGDAWRARQGGVVGSDSIAKGEQTPGDGTSVNRLEPQDLIGPPEQRRGFSPDRAVGFPDNATQLDPRFGSRLREHGFEMVDESLWYKFQLDDGNYAIVPVDRKRIVPVGQ